MLFSALPACSAAQHSLELSPAVRSFAHTVKKHLEYDLRDLGVFVLKPGLLDISSNRSGSRLPPCHARDEGLPEGNTHAN